MSEEIFMAIKADIERRGIYYGEISVTLKFHDGRVDFYTVTTTERRNCGNGNRKNTRKEKEQ